ncbi:MAG: DHHA1 domain-containing protein, partial [Actinomycetales bacterium]
VQAPVPGLYVHRGIIREGEIATGESIHAAIDMERRIGISRAHTATHMVHKAFRELLGETATQAGSENAPGRFRFDFPATGAVPKSIIEEVEFKVNDLLQKDLEVSAQEMSLDEAKSMGAMALFGEKYGEKVRVVSVGDWAKELCGGTHVSRSGQLGLIKILSESSIGAGVRRVEALVGVDAFRFLAREHVLLNSLTELIKGAKTEDLPERISELVSRVKEVEKEIKLYRRKRAEEELQSNLKIQGIAGIKFLHHHFNYEIDSDDLRQLALQRQDMEEGLVSLLSATSGERLILVVSVSQSAKAKGVKAGELAKISSEILGGGGGGKDDFAQGGGPNKDRLAEAINAVQAKLVS